MLLTLLLTAAQPVDSPIAKPDCSYDLEAMLELDLQAFDQDLNGGWRTLANREGCERAAAELIREWRHEKRNHRHILYWHEGQMRASAGETEVAIALFNLTRKDLEGDADFGWNHYVEGSIAFLRRDKEALLSAIERLKAVPESEDNSFTRPDGTVVQMAWPPNLNVLRRFEYCWGRPYADVYGSEECTPPALSSDR